MNRNWKGRDTKPFNETTVCKRKWSKINEQNYCMQTEKTDKVLCNQNVSKYKTEKGEWTVVI